MPMQVKKKVIRIIFLEMSMRRPPDIAESECTLAGITPGYVLSVELLPADVLWGVESVWETGSVGVNEEGIPDEPAVDDVDGEPEFKITTAACESLTNTDSSPV